jgi:hypothetical protein
MTGMEGADFAPKGAPRSYMVQTERAFGWLVWGAEAWISPLLGRLPIKARDRQAVSLGGPRLDWIAVMTLVFLSLGR